MRGLTEEAPAPAATGNEGTEQWPLDSTQPEPTGESGFLSEGPPLTDYDDMADSLGEPGPNELAPADQYLERKGIPLEDLQSACSSAVEMRQDRILSDTGFREGMILFRELVDVRGSHQGYERILGEKIPHNGKLQDKRTSKGGRTSDTFTPIGFTTKDLGAIGERIIVCGGFADGYRIHEATGDPVACGVGENTLTAIADSISERHKGEILVAVDNDEAGHRAGSESGYPWVCPEHHKDWSDVHQEQGPEAVKDAVNDFIPPEIPEHDHPLSLSKASIGDLIRTEPPARRWIVQDELPLNIAGILAAAGGTGKTIAALQLGVSVATGLPWLGMEISEPGSVVIFSAEDDKDEIHRRLAIIVEHYRDLAGATDDAGFSQYMELLEQRLYVFDRVGFDNRLTMKESGQNQRTRLAHDIAMAGAPLDDLKLIVLDPLSRFDGGEPNDNADGTRLIEAIESIRRDTGASVIVPHHVSKAGMKDSGSGQEAVRGASGLVDGARWVGLMSTLRTDEAKDYGIEEEDAGRYVRFRTPKANYKAPSEGMWLERLAGGVLVPSELKPAKEGKRERKADADYQRILRGICDLIKKHGPMSKRYIEDHYGGQANILKAGQKAVRDVMTRAIEEGDLIGRTRMDRQGITVELPTSEAGSGQ